MWMIKWKKLGPMEPVRTVVGEPDSITALWLILRKQENLEFITEISLDDGEEVMSHP